jgi:hypothetical protein
MQSVSLSTSSNIDVSPSPASRMACRVYPLPQPAVWTGNVYPLQLQTVWTFRVYPFLQPAEWMCRLYPFSTPAVWTCRVSPLAQPAVWTCRVCPLPQPAESSCRVYSFSPPGVRTCRVYPLPTQTVLTCRVSFHDQQCERAGFIPVLCLWCVHAECMHLFFKTLECWTVRYWNKGTSPVPECSGTGLRYQKPE